MQLGLDQLRSCEAKKIHRIYCKWKCKWPIAQCTEEHTQTHVCRTTIVVISRWQLKEDLVMSLCLSPLDNFNRTISLNFNFSLHLRFCSLCMRITNSAKSREYHLADWLTGWLNIVVSHNRNSFILCLTIICI